MTCRRAQLSKGIYLTSPLGLFRVHAIRAGKGGVTDCVLTDESTDLSTQRLGDGRYVVVEGEQHTVPMHRVLADFDVLDRPGIASETEWGKAG